MNLGGNTNEYEKGGGLLGLVPQKLKTQITRTRYISAYYAIFTSTDWYSYTVLSYIPRISISYTISIF